MKPEMIKQIRKKSLDEIEKLALRTTRFIGSTESLLLHTALFVVSFLLYFWGFELDKILLTVTTIVSLEAIYLSIFIQMSVNQQSRRLHAVARDVDEIQKDVEEIQEDVEEIQEDVEEIQEDDQTEEDEEKKDEEILGRIEDTMGKLIEEVIELKKQHNEIKNKAK